MSFQRTNAPPSTLTQNESSSAVGAITRPHKRYVPAATFTLYVTRFGPGVAVLLPDGNRYTPEAALASFTRLNVGEPLRTPDSASNHTALGKLGHAAQFGPPQSTPVSL
jgi:hypothetical protein